MKSKSTQVLFHVIGCTIFLSLPILFWPGQGGLDDFFSDYRAVRGYINDILILLFFYLNFYFLVPGLYFKKKYTYFILALAICFLVIAFLPRIIFPYNEPFHADHPPGPGRYRMIFFIGHNLVFFLAVVFFSLMVKINNRWRQSEKEKLKAELSYFKAQINPHFLFNTLNTIYSLAIRKAENTPEAVVKLSGMMRYVIYDASNDLVPLDDEISYIGDYIELQKIRYGDTVKIGYNPCEPGSEWKIAALILIPFIENAFKFGVNPGKDSYISMDISLSGPELHMKVFNYKVNGNDKEDASGGVGISNARKRLALLYPGKHRLLIAEDERSYTVNLYIDLS